MNTSWEDGLEFMYLISAEESKCLEKMWKDGQFYSNKVKINLKTEEAPSSPSPAHGEMDILIPLVDGVSFLKCILGVYQKS